MEVVLVDGFILPCYVNCPKALNDNWKILVFTREKEIKMGFVPVKKIILKKTNRKLNL